MRPIADSEDIEYWIGRHFYESPLAHPNIERALFEVMKRLPDKIAENIMCPDEQEVHVFCCSEASTVAAYNVLCQPHKEIKQVWLTLIVLGSTLEDEPFDCIVGTIAHEFAHFIREDDGNVGGDYSNERAADQLASEWGFAQEIQEMRAV